MCVEFGMGWDGLRLEAFHVGLGLGLVRVRLQCEVRLSVGFGAPAEVPFVGYNSKGRKNVLLHKHSAAPQVPHTLSDFGERDRVYSSSTVVARNLEEPAYCRLVTVSPLEQGVL